jgi:D-arabinose 1-dehydrogenase-like Zn-dependent alcohol dehydrogenase
MTKTAVAEGRGVSLPRTMGHETVGEVLAFGPDAKAVTGGFQTRLLLVEELVAYVARPVATICGRCTKMNVDR